MCLNVDVEMVNFNPNRDRLPESDKKLSTFKESWHKKGPKNLKVRWSKVIFPD